MTNRSGTGYYTQKLLEFLGRADSEHRYVIFCPKGYEAHVEHPGMFDYPNYRVIELKTNSPISIALWRQFALPAQIAKLNIDLFHFPAFIASLRADVPTVVTIHDVCFHLFPEAFSLLRRHYYKFIIPRSIARSTAVIADSESTRKDILDNFPATRRNILSSVHLGVDPVRFFQDTDAGRREALRKQYGLPEQFILYVGTLEPRKNIPRLIKAFADGVVGKGLPHDLVIAGRKGWMFDEIFKTAHTLKIGDRVHFTGFVEPEQLAALYSMARALAYPSLYEGFGLPCLEAMSCGTPVVTSNRSSLPEFAGDCGLTVDPESVDSIAAALEKICTDDKCHRDLARRGVQRARHYSWLTTAKKTLEVYNRVLAETS
jgi:glycosyltransferase involved in cell wall biosynthesis